MSDHVARAPRILIAGIGNIFLGDDAFGVEVGAPAGGPAAAAEACGWSTSASAGFDLAYALLDDATTSSILVDAAPRGEPPARSTSSSPSPEGGGTGPLAIAAARDPRLDPARVLRLVGGPRRPGRSASSCSAASPPPSAPTTTRWWS